MRLEDLRVFSTLAKSPSFHRAANKVGMTQSGVTKALQRLEGELGIVLVDRGAKGVVLTPAGQTLREMGESMLLAADDIHVQMAAIRSAEAGVVRVGTVPALLETTLLPLLGDYVRRRSDCRFEVSVQVSSKLVEHVLDGKLDLALCFSSEIVPDGLQADDLGQQIHYVVARQGHRLGTLDGDMDALAAADWLLPPKGVAVRTLLEQHFHDLGYPPIRVVVDTDSSSAWFTSLVRNSELVTILTDQVLASDLGKGLTALPYRIALSNPLRLFYRRKSYMPPANLEFRAALHQAIGPRRRKT